MRRVFIIFTMTALLVAGLALPALARDKIALGIANPFKPGMGAVDYYREDVGLDGPATPSFYTIWSQWGDRGGNANCYPAEAGTCAFPSTFLDQLDEVDISGVIWWQPYDPATAYPNGEQYARHKKTYNGQKNDAYIENWIDDVVAFGQSHPGRTVYIRLAHEANGKFFDWRTGNWDNTFTTYKKFWRYVWKKFQAKGALPYVKFIWSTANPKKGMYPGNKYVDFVDPLALNWGTPWKSLKVVVKWRIDRMAKITGKPIIITEIGTANGPGSKPDWITNGYPKVYSKFPKVKGMIYLFSNQPFLQYGDPDWSLPLPSAGLDAYVAIAEKPKFQGRR